MARLQSTMPGDIRKSLKADESEKLSSGETSIISESKKKSNKKWNDANEKERYDRVQLVLIKGERDLLKAYAASRGESLNALFIRAVKAQIVRDQAAEDSKE